jgi:hypothetical protein
LQATAVYSATPDLCGEPAFPTNDHDKFHFDSHNQAEENKALFAHAIVRHPRDLRLHVQRILLHAETGDPAILGALYDLFLVLEKRGAPLRRRMLSLARPLLSHIDYQNLQQQLAHGESCSTSLHSPGMGSVLSDGIIGTTRLITRLSQPAASREDPLVCARQQLERGQTELAQETLEIALQVNPGRLALHLALLEIYRNTRDLRHIEAFWQSLQGKENPAKTEWQRLLSQLEDNA